MPRVTHQMQSKGKMPTVPEHSNVDYPDVKTVFPELFPPGDLGEEERDIVRDYKAARYSRDRRVSFSHTELSFSSVRASFLRTTQRHRP